MWGSTFADLARKAQELQDQAASTVSSQTSSLFNLDAMQNMSAALPARAEPKEKQHHQESSTSSSKDAASPPTATAGALPQQQEQVTKQLNQASQEAIIDVVKDEATQADEQRPTEPRSWSLGSPANVPAVTTAEQEGGDGWKEEAQIEEDSEIKSIPAGETETVKPDAPGVMSDKKEMEPAALSQTNAPESTIENEETPVAIDAPDGPPVADTTISQNEPTVTTVRMDRDVPSSPVPPTPIPPTPSTPTTHVRTKLIMLISSMPIHRQVLANQDLAMTVLKWNDVDFEVLDGVEEKDLRNELFNISGRRGDYPQFFLVNLTLGGTTFWGGWDEFHSENENGNICNVFPTTRALLTSPDVVMTPKTMKTAKAPDETVMQSFAEQIKRIEENHQAELTLLEQEHAKALAMASNHEKYVAQIKEMEARLGQQILAKESQIQELCRRDEGYRLKLDMLQREVTGTQEILQQKDSIAGKVSQQHLNELRSMEKKLVQAETKATQINDQFQQMQTTLNNARNELTASRNEHGELKERTKLVATELKERRAECRELRGKIEEMESEHQHLQREIETLKDQLSHQGLNQTEKDGEMGSLRSQLDQAMEAYKKAEREWKEQELKHEQTLADYKKKAQNSLSMANSRTAAAVQAREEAELDARAARSTADSAFERATAAEISSREAVAEARAALRTTERERDDAKSKMTQLMEAKARVDGELEAMQTKLNQVVASRDEKGIELEAMRADLRAEQSQLASFQHQITENDTAKKKLRAEIESLNMQLEGTKRALEAVEKGRDSEAHSTNVDTFSQKSDDGTVTALRQELREANESIEYLKDALKNAVEMNEKSAEPSNGGAARQQEHAVEQNDGIPLFYAMEKQAELKTARAEINRLANELANLQSDKAEAVESMAAMRQRMEESEARLRRFEKLAGTEDSGPTAQNGQTPAHGSRAMNIEYLKHIMLKYITAKTTTERKALVPVIGAVLELTSDELTKALASVEQTASASTSFFGLL